MTDLIMTILAQNRQIKSVIKLGAKVRAIQGSPITICDIISLSLSQEGFIFYKQVRCLIIKL